MTATIDPLLITGYSARPARPTVRPQTPARRSASVYRRRRMAVVAATVFAVASVLLATGAFATQPTTENLRSIPRTHVVEAGDTLWSIARGYAPTGNISEFVRELARENGVDIEVGQVIRIP
ncbi:MAG: LysM domain [Actinomycetota bacterium]